MITITDSIIKAIKTKATKDINKTNRDNDLTDNIYGIKGKFKDMKNMQKRIFGWFKYGFIVPALLIGKRIAGRWLVTEIPDEPKYEVLKVFDDSVEQGLLVWQDVFQGQMIPGSHNIDNIKKIVKEGNNGIGYVRLAKQLGLTGVKHDSAYLEMFNIIAFVFYENMYKTFGTNPKHLLYTSRNVNDTTYFICKKTLTNLCVEEIKKLSKEENENGEKK